MSLLERSFVLATIVISRINCTKLPSLRKECYRTVMMENQCSVISLSYVHQVFRAVSGFQCAWGRGSITINNNPCPCVTWPCLPAPGFAPLRSDARTREGGGPKRARVFPHWCALLQPVAITLATTSRSALSPPLQVCQINLRRNKDISTVSITWL